MDTPIWIQKYCGVQALEQLQADSAYRWFIVLSGSLICVKENEAKEAVRHSLFAVLPGEQYRLRCNKNTKPEILSIAAEREYFQNTLKEQREELLYSLWHSERMWRLQMEDYHMLVYYYNRLCGQKLSGLQCITAVGLLVDVMLNGYDIPLSAPSWLIRAVYQMRSMKNVKLGYERFVELCDRSEYQISKEVKKYYNKTPRNLISDMQLDAAFQYFISTNEKIAWVVKQVGFGSSRNLQRAFKKRFGRSPVEVKNVIESDPRSE